MSAASNRHAMDTLPIKVYFRDGSQITVKLGALANFSDLHRAVVMKVRGMKEQMVLKETDPLIRYFALYTVTTENYIGTQKPSFRSIFPIMCALGSFSEGGRQKKEKERVISKADPFLCLVGDV